MIVKVRFSTRLWNPFSIAIRLLSGSRHSHVSFLLHENLILGSSFLGGVQFREDDGKDNRVDVRYVVVPDDSAVLSLAKSRIGRRYDYLYLLEYLVFRLSFGLISWGIEDDGRLVCQEFVLDCFKCSGIKLVNTKDIGVLTPRDLLISPLMLTKEELDEYLSREVGRVS